MLPDRVSNPGPLTYYRLRYAARPHDVDIEGSKPIKQHPYGMNPMKLQYLREEVQYLLDIDFIESSQSDWSVPYILVPKLD